MEIFEIKDLSFKYALGKEYVLENVSFDVSEGQWICLTGETGSGKTTLLKLLKKELTMTGIRDGKILFKGQPLEEVALEKSASEIGYVGQNPTQQIVTDKVWHELSFGLENLGIKSDVIRRQVAELASYFGIEEWYEKNTADLSGGQKQILNLASVMVMRPDVLLLDEPTAQLDPIAADEFLTIINKLHKDFGLTIIMVEHSLEKVLINCDKVLALKNKSISFFDSVDEFVKLADTNSFAYGLLPAGCKLAIGLDENKEHPLVMRPLSIKQSRDYLKNYLVENNLWDSKELADKIALKRNQVEKTSGGINMPAEITSDIALEFKGVYFAYDKNSIDILNDLDFAVRQGEIITILGGNGSGKTTALLNAAGLLKPYSGKVFAFGKQIKDYKNGSLYNQRLTLLPQDVTTMFLYNTVKEELKSVGAEIKTDIFDFENILEMHPYDLSGGQQQLLGLAKVLAVGPRLLLIDEPTKGLDYSWKNKIIDVLKALKAKGITIVVVSHDVDFAASVSDRCALLFRGAIVSVDEVHSFFRGNRFYTGDVVKITQGIIDYGITVEEIVDIVK